VEVVARDTARLRVKVFRRGSPRGKDLACIGWAPVHSRKWIPGNYCRLKKRRAFFHSTSLSTLSVGLFMKYKFAFRTAYVPRCGRRRRHFGDNSRGGCFRSCCKLTPGGMRVAAPLWYRLLLDAWHIAWAIFVCSDAFVWSDVGCTYTYTFLFALVFPSIDNHRDF